MGNVIGIDLGTTNTAVSVLKDGRPRMLEDSHGYKVVPSIVWIGDQGVVKVGQQCKALLVTDPSRTAFAVKRILGRHFSSQEVNDAHSRVGYNILEDDDGGCLVELRSETLTPVEVSAHVLRTAKEMAENALGGPVQEAVITVPAYFNHAQRSATLEAAKHAGLHCERLLNEPTAAALAYGFRKEIDRTLLVFDLGGGTFDVSVLKLAKGVYEILSTLGDSYLGGEDFDHRIVDWVAERFEQSHGVDLRQDRIKLHRLKEAAEKAKCELSFTETVSIQIPHIHEGQSVDERLDRDTLIALVQDYIDRALEVSLNAVRDAGLDSGDIDEVILVGGQTRMPAIREAITTAFGQEPSRSVHPEEVVAMGAAVHAASLMDESEVPPAVLIDVTPFDLGIDVASGMFQPIISRNSAIPTAASRIFATAKANQASVQITVRQGSSRMASDNEFLGEFIMSGLTPAPRMETKVEVNFQIDTNGMLRVSAVEPATGKQAEITVRNFGEVAGSKGSVSPDVRRAPGAVSPDDVDGKKDAATVEADDGKPTKQSKTKKVKKKAKKEKKSAEGGGLLGALFGRMSKTRTKRSAPAPAETDGSSIIDQVVAEREAAQGQPANAEGEEILPRDESPMKAESIQLPDIDPSALEALEPDMDEPAPIQLPELGSDDLDPIDDLDALDDLGADALEELGVDDLQDLGVDDLEALDDLDGPAIAAVDATSVESTPVQAAYEPLDESAGLMAEDESGLTGSEKGPVDQQSSDMRDHPSQPIGDDMVDEPTDPNGGGTLGAESEVGPQVPVDDPGPSAATVPPLPEPVAPEPVAPEPIAKPSKTPPSRRKTARLKLSYKNPQSVVREYTENLQRGGCFIKTPKPLAVGREVLIEVRVPSIENHPISIPGVVTWSSRDLDELEPGQDAGMGIEYLLDDIAKAQVVDRLATLT